MHFYIVKCYFFTLDILFVRGNDSFSGPVTGHYRWFTFSNFENNSDKVSEKYIAIESFLFQKISCYLPLSNKEMSTRAN